jgi:hypothetical protein
VLKSSIIVALLLGILGDAICEEQKSTTGRVASQSAVEVMLMTERNSYHLGAPITVTIGLKNVGSVAVLIPKDFQLADSPYGGFDIEFVDSHDSTVDLPGRSWSAPPDLLRPANERKEDFFLLEPGYSYGRTVTLSNVPRKRGRFKVIAIFNGPSILASEQRAVQTGLDRVVRGIYKSIPQIVTLK